MELTPKIQKAINIAAEKHLGQIRKADGLPYITHPFSVAILLSDCTDDEDVICAGLLHDVLEDVKGYGFTKLEKDFGWKVAGIVKEVSEDKDPDVESNQKATWKKRKIGYIEHLKKASKEAMLVCAADKIHNLLSMIDSYEKQGGKMWRQFNASPEESMWFYKECLDVIRKSLDSKIVKHFGYAYVLAEKIILGKIRQAEDHHAEINKFVVFKTIFKPVKKTLSNKPRIKAIGIVPADEEVVKKMFRDFEKEFKEKNTKTEEERKEEVIRKHWEFYKYLYKHGFKNL